MALIALLASSLALAQSQLHDQIRIVNPDIIYFNDGGQRYPLNVQPIPDQRPQPNPYIRNEENHQSAQGMRAPVNTIPQIGPHSNVNQMYMNFNPNKSPSHELEPPYFKPSRNEQTDVFEATNRFSDDAGNGASNDVKRPDTPQPVSKVSRAVSQFGINVMKIVQEQPGNVVMSPFSIGTSLALLQQGAGGGTQEQITNALQMTKNEAADGFKGLTENLEKRVSPNIFKVANGLFLYESYPLNPAFKRVAMRDFATEIIPVKFSRPEQTADKINSWVSSKTNNKIPELVSPEAIGVSMQLVLANAVYFKGIWAVKFRPEATQAKEFYMPNGATKMANYMRMRRYFRTDYDPSIGSQVLVLPFEGDQYSLVVILPSESGTVASALSSLTSEKLLAYQNYTPKEVALELPKFTIKSETNLVPVLKRMGITYMFSPDSDLSGFGHYREFAPQVSSALHSAMLSIDEQGGTAAAATSFGVVALSYDEPSITFKANRPFIAVLWDKETSVPLFMAKIENPVQ